VQSTRTLTDLPWRFPIFADLVKLLDAHVAAFAKDAGFDLGDKALKLEDIWINILPPGGIHTGHIHPHSAISGTTYVAMMMAAPPRKQDVEEALRQFVYVAPAPGDVLLWESWLRHEVPMNMSEEEERISISFNYAWD